ncbi:MAG: hypothetical protein ABL878_15620 [Burkholderiales bacterium]
MITRLNFLLGLGFLIVIGFYFVGRYAIVFPLSLLIPSWTRPVAGLAVLLGLGLTVQLLAISMGKYAGVASYPPGQAMGSFSIASQIALACGHAGLIYAGLNIIEDRYAVSELQLFTVAALYGAGVLIAIQEWRQREE